MVDRISRELGAAEILAERLGERRSALAQAAALHVAAIGDAFEGALSYCERMAFFKNSMARRPHGSHLACDSASVSARARGIASSEPGCDKDGTPSESVGQAGGSETEGGPSPDALFRDGRGL